MITTIKIALEGSSSILFITYTDGSELVIFAIRDVYSLKEIFSLVIVMVIHILGQEIQVLYRCDEERLVWGTVLEYIAALIIFNLSEVRNILLCPCPLCEYEQGGNGE